MGDKLTRADIQAFADEVSAYLHRLAFTDEEPYDRPLPPVLGDSDVLRRIRHDHGCACRICRLGS